MSLTSVKTMLESKFNTDWADTTVVSWDNVEFKATEVEEWVRFTVIPGDEFQASAGGSVNTFRLHGVVAVQIFVVPNSGAKRATELADIVSNIWRAVIVGSAVFKAPKIKNIGLNRGWDQINVMIEFHSDELK